MNIFESVKDFIGQSERVIAITHKPRTFEYKQMALTTGLGIAIIGLIGFAITMAVHFLRP